MKKWMKAVVVVAGILAVAGICVYRKVSYNVDHINLRNFAED